MELMGKRYNNVHSFTYKDRYFIFDTYIFFTMETSRKFYELMKLIETNKYYNEEYFSNEFELVKKLCDMNYFFSDLSFEEMVDGESNGVANLSFAPIYQCNFKCKYCFADKRRDYNIEPDYFDAAMVKKVVKWFAFNAFPNSTSYKIEFVSGGEPLLNFEAVKAAIEYTKEIEMKTRKKFSIWLCTNGTLLTNEICDYLDKNNISIGISLDGNEKVNNCNRIDKEGNGTYQKVIDSINTLLCNLNYSKKFKEIWGLSVITKNNTDLVDIIEHHKKVGFKNVQMKIVRSSQQEIKISDSKLIINEYEKLADWLLHSLEEEIKTILMVLNNNDYFGKVLKRIILKTAYLYRCKAGRSKITVCPNGDIYPCDSFVGDCKFLLGNIESGESIGNCNFKSVNMRKECSKCSVKYICGGDCYYNSYITTGNTDIPDLGFCEVNKAICNIAIHLCLEMEHAYPEKFLTIQKIIDYKDKIIKE